MENEKALEKGPLERLFIGPAMAKILDFMILFRNYDYSKTDIAKNSGVNFRTVLRLLPILEEKQIVKQTRLVGQAKMYQINRESPLAQALHNGQIAGAGLDVFATEPPPPDSKFWEFDNVYITPHIAGRREDYDATATGLFCENHRRYLSGKKLLNVVEKKRGY